MLITNAALKMTFTYTHVQGLDLIYVQRWGLGRYLTNILSFLYTH